MAYKKGGGTGGGHNVTLSGNSTSAGAGYIQISSGTMTLAGGNNITLSQNGNAITISGANAGGVQTGISGVIASNATFTSGTVSFADANGISFGGELQTRNAEYVQFALQNYKEAAQDLYATLIKPLPKEE